jgi:AcrR family transcriptional regulator
MGYHGWHGDPPRSEELARERLITAANRCIDRVGVAKTTLTEVAIDAGVTRQTVYRYYPSLADLLRAVAESGAAAFVDRMQTHLCEHCLPVDVVIEAIVFCLQELPREPRIGILLYTDDEDLFGRGITSSTGFDLGAQFLRQLPVDWLASRITDSDLDGLAELMLRLIGSLTQHPSATPRTADETRSYLRRWLGPALAAAVT